MRIDSATLFQVRGMIATPRGMEVPQETMTLFVYDKIRTYLKAMLHEAIFLATCLATMTTEKHCKLERGCHTFAIFLRNLQCPLWKLFTALSPPAWNLLRAKDGLWLPNFHKMAWQVAVDMSNAATCLATLRKVEDISTSLATRNATFCCRCRGCYTWNLSCNLSRNVCCETSCKKNCLV